MCQNVPITLKFALNINIYLHVFLWFVTVNYLYNKFIYYATLYFIYFAMAYDSFCNLNWSLTYRKSYWCGSWNYLWKCSHNYANGRSGGFQAELQSKMIFKNPLIVAITLTQNNSEFICLKLNTWRSIWKGGEIKKGMHSGSVTEAVTSWESRAKEKFDFCCFIAG